MPWNQNRKNTKAKPRSRINYKMTAGISIVFVLSVVTWIIIPSVDKPEIESKGKSKRSRTVERPKIKKTVKQAVVKKQSVKDSALKEETPKKPEWKMPEGLQTEVLEDGVILSEVPTNMPSHVRNPYKTQVESLLSMLGKPGTPYTPLPLDPNMDLDADFIKAMENTITVWLDESIQTEQHKKMVNWMKRAVAEARKEGWKVNDLLRELEKERKHQWEMLSEAQTILVETEQTTPESTASVRKILNQELDQVGVDPLPKTETEDLVEQKELQEENR